MSGKGYAGGQMVMEFYPDRELSDNPSNWWSPTLHCLGSMVAVAGFDRGERICHVIEVALGVGAARNGETQ